jgi:hypothetical protein
MDIGAGAIARGVQGLGGAMYEVGQKIDAAESAVELSTMERKAREKANAALLAAQNNGSPESIEAISKQLEKDINAIKTDSKRPRVQNAFQMKADSFIPQYSLNLQSTANQARIGQIKADDANNDAADYDDNNKANFAKRKVSMATLGIITQRQAEKEIGTFDIERSLHYAARTMDISPKSAASFLSGLNTGDMDDRQLQRYTTLKAVAERQSAQNSDQAENQVLFNMNKNSKLPLNERMKLAEQYTSQLEKSGISPERAGVMLDRIDKWQKGEDVKSQPKLFADLRTEIVNAKANGIDTADVRKKIDSNIDNLSIGDYNSLRDDLDKKVAPHSAKALLLATNAYKSSLSYDEETEPYFQAAMMNWQEEHPKATINETLKAGYEMAAMWESKSPEQIIQDVTSEEVKVVSPKGKTGKIKKSDLDAALKEGYKVL